MGGLAGHMYHLYDNPGLTFGEIKDIFSKAADGKLSGTEKTDGLNIYISYSVRTGEVKAARNKSNIKDSGCSNQSSVHKYFFSKKDFGLEYSNTILEKLFLNFFLIRFIIGLYKSI
jgi:hypothetical protein